VAVRDAELPDVDEPPPERVASGFGDLIRCSPRIAVGGAIDRSDQAARHEALQVPVEIPGADLYPRAVAVLLHQGIAVPRRAAV
jgi:hypothetical protein